MTNPVVIDSIEVVLGCVEKAKKEYAIDPSNKNIESLNAFDNMIHYLEMKNFEYEDEAEAIKTTLSFAISLNDKIVSDNQWREKMNYLNAYGLIVNILRRYTGLDEVYTNMNASSIPDVDINDWTRKLDEEEVRILLKTKAYK